MQQEIWFQKYRIIRLLGRGGTAKVYLAEHIRLKSHRAIKCLSKTHPFYDSQLKEAQILKNLKHSCIPIIYDIEEDEDGSYIVEQYLEGETLKDYVAVRGSLSSETTVSFTLQLCDLIHDLHHIERPVLYLDLKPENIIVTGKALKLVDFGSAVYRDETDDGQQEYYGTIGYAAPELYRHGRIDERCDVYGIGMLLHYMATGKSLKGEGAQADRYDIGDNCPKRLKKIINRCISFNPSQRYASVKQLSRQLSAGRKKPQVLCESGPTIRIAVAGAQPRIGVTHLAFRLCRFFMHKQVSCIYQERNQGRCVRAIISRCQAPKLSGNTIKLGGIAMLDSEQAEEEDIAGYRIAVEDFGCLSKDNLSAFYGAEVPLLVMGAKDWELENAEQVLEMVAEYKDIVYLFSYLNGRQFRQVIKHMDCRSCFRIPYEPEPFTTPVKGAELEFFEDLLNLIAERIMT